MNDSNPNDVTVVREGNPIPAERGLLPEHPQRIGRSEDNVESMKLRFETFKADTLPIVEHFRSNGRWVEIDNSQDRQTVYQIVKDQLASHKPLAFAESPLSERAEMLLGIRPYPTTTPRTEPLNSADRAAEFKWQCC